MARTALDALLGRLLDDGTELELLGGLNFVGFAITEGEGHWTVTYGVTGPLTGITTINGATVCAPVEGAVVTTTATIDVSQGNQRTVTAAGGAYAITLHASTGSPYTGESITLVCATALANAVTVTNGGAGGGNIGFSGGTIPSGFKGAASFYFDGTNWALSVGSVIRFA